MKNLKSYLLLASLLMCLCTITKGQDQFIGVTLSNNTTGLPVLGYPKLFYSQFHPGIDATYTKQLNKSEINKLYVNGTVGFYYHQFVQSLLRIYPSLSYERQFSDRFSLGGGLGAGYGLSFEGRNAFVLNDDGTYENKAFFGARSQYLISVELSSSYKIFPAKVNSAHLLLQFKSFMQGTYVKSYVPLLPLNSINIGLRFPL